MKAPLVVVMLFLASVGCGGRNLGVPPLVADASPTAAEVCSGGSVTFQLAAAPGDAGLYVVQALPACWKSNWVRIFDQSSAERTLIHPPTDFDCETCAAPTFSATCATTNAAAMATAVATWNGQYFADGSCGQAGAACVQPRCADPGRYLVAMCASNDQQATTGTRCVDVPFDYPTAAPVTGVLPPAAHH